LVVCSLRLKFYLLKADGTPSHEFGCGENIVFQFSIENLAKEKRIIRSDSGIGSLFYDLFMVYRKSDNEYVGRPWDSLFGNDLGGGMSLEPEIKRLWRCAWQVGTEIPFAGYMGFLSTSVNTSILLIGRDRLMTPRIYRPWIMNSLSSDIIKESFVKICYFRRLRKVLQ